MSYRTLAIGLLQAAAVFAGGVNADVFRWDNGHRIPRTEGIELGPGIELSPAFRLAFADMRDVDLSRANLSGADLNEAKFTNSDLTSARLSFATLTGADFSGAVINGTHFSRSGITAEQYYSTASYAKGNLARANFHGVDASGWDLSGKNLRGGFFSEANLTNASLTGADLTDAHFGTFPLASDHAVIANADFSDAVVAGTNFAFTGLNREQLYSTASYKSGTLLDVSLVGGDRSGWDLSGQDLTGADFGNRHIELAADLSRTDFSGGKLVGADLIGVNLSGTNLTDVDLRSACLDESHIEDEAAKPIFSRDTLYNEWTTFPDWLDPRKEGLRFVKSTPGDFNEDGEITADDYDLFSRYLGASFENDCDFRTGMMDLARDGAISFLDEPDRVVWVKDIKGTWFGDANLDGEFNSTDLVVLFEAGEFEDRFARNSGWATGDWNGDRDFDSADLVLAFQDGGYERGPLPLANTVPEPQSVTVFLAALVLLVQVGREQSPNVKRRFVEARTSVKPCVA